jgi:hypothetical protein
LLDIACPHCGSQLCAPADIPVDPFQCPACGVDIALSEAARAAAEHGRRDNATVRVRQPVPRDTQPPLSAGAASERGTLGPRVLFTPRQDGFETNAFDGKRFVRRLWLTVFGVVALLLALIYMDVTFDASRRVFGLFKSADGGGAATPPPPQPAPKPAARAETALPWDTSECPAPPAVAYTPPAETERHTSGNAPPAETTAVREAPSGAQIAAAFPESPAAPETPTPAADEQAAALPPSVAAARRLYDLRLEAIQRESAWADAEWSQAYLQALDALQNQMQQAGDLDGWMAGRDEAARFELEPTIPVAVAPGTNPRLLALQDTFQKYRADLLLWASRETVDLTQLYIRHLERTQQEQTRAGQFGEALQIKAEVARARAGAAYAAAEFHLAVLACARDGSAPQPVTGTQLGATQTVVTAASKVVTPVRADADGAAPLIRRGPMGPSSHGISFERLALRPTGPVRDRSNYEALVMRGVSSNLQSRADAAAGLTGAATETWLNNYIVVGLRTTSRTLKVESPRVKIEYFVRAIAAAEGREVPRRATVDTVNLPELANEWIYIDCAPIATRQLSSEYKNATFSRRTIGGEVLHGVIVSILNRAGKTVYEAVAAAP